MAQMESIQKIKTSESPQTPRTRSSPTFEELLHADISKWPPSNSPQALRRDHEMHEDSHHNRKSVISKVKERAKKLRNSMSKKRLHHDSCSSPCSNPSHENCESPGSILNFDDDDEYEDGEDTDEPEYLGAPMYESEMAPESYKENARQHPRADPVLSESHVLASSQHDQQPEPMVEDKKAPISPSKAGTITGTVTQKLAPAYNAVSDATYSIASRIAGLTISTSLSQEEPLSTELTQHPGRVIMGNNDYNNNNTGNQTYDKGVSVKEYFMNKLEPGEDEKALSQAITEAISPKSHSDMGVVEKVKGAVTSLLRSDETSQPATRVAHPASPIPVSTNAYPVYEEETHGRILQTN